MWQCKKCDQWKFDTDKECDCKTFKIIDNYGEEHDIHGMDREDAALKFAEYINTECDYCLMGETVEIEVDGKKFKISAEPDIHYSANEIQPLNKEE